MTWTTPSASRFPFRTWARSTPGCLRGDPLTLVDTGPREDEALSALEAGLARAGVRVEDIELVLVTHHHLDHTGLAATIAGRSGARIGAFDRAAAYGRNYAERTAADRRYSLALMRHHGVPEAVIVDNEGFWDFIERASDAYDTDVELPDGATIRAGGRDLRVVARPGHSTTDALLVDERERIAFVGDHLLGGISSNTEVYPALEPDGTRPRARVEYLAEPARNGRHATRPAADRARRRGHRARRPRPRSGSATTTVAAIASSRCSAAAAPAPSRSPRTSGRRGRSPSSRCSSSGRCSGTSTSCSTPAGRRGARDRGRQYLRCRVLRPRRYDTTTTPRR